MYEPFTDTARLNTVRVLVQPGRSHPNKSDFRYPLSRTLRGVRRIRLLSAAIPNSNTNVQNGVSDKLYVTPATGTPVQTFLLEQNHNFVTLPASIKTALEVVAPGQTWAVDYNETTFQTTIRSNQPFTIDPEIQRDSVLPLLGFELKQTAVAIGAEYWATGQAAISLNTNKYVCVHLDNVQGSGAIEFPGVGMVVSGWTVPMFANPPEVCFATERDIAGELVFRSEHLDLSHLDVQLLRTDRANTPYTIKSNFSLLFEIEYTH